MNDRHTVDSLTSDALDALYDQLNAAEAGEAQRQLATAREALAAATTRAARAEAALARVRAVAGWAIQGWSDLSPEKVLLAVEGEQPAPAPAATQATDDDCCGKPSGAVCVHDVSVPKQQPREHFLRTEITALRDDLNGITGARWIADMITTILDKEQR